VKPTETMERCELLKKYRFNLC